MTRYTHARADIIIAVSAGAADDYARHYKTPAAKIQVIYNPVISPPLFATARLPLDHPWLVTGQPPVIIGISRLSEEKDFANLIESFAIVRATGQQCRLMILGEGELWPSLESLVQQRGLQDDVTLPGFVDNPFQYLSHARLFVLSSRCEGLSTALIEAMAFSTPVVSTNCRNGPIEILDNGRFGAPVPIENAEALATVICAELAKKKLGPPKESWERFDVEHAVDSYLEFLRPPINLHKPN